MNHYAWLAAPLADALRALYSMRFYQEIDWHCYSGFGAAVLRGERNYENMLCDYGYNVYPAAMSWLYAGIQAVTDGRVDRILLVHVVVWTVLSVLAYRTYAPHMTRGRWLFFVLPLLAQSPFRAAISRVTNDTWVALFTVLLHGLVQQRRFWGATVVYAVLLSLKMNSLLLAPAMLTLYVRHLRSARLVLPHMALGAALMLALALPFLWERAHAMSYLRLTYDFSRLFEHRVNMAWGFLGDELRHSPHFSHLLLGGTAFALLGWCLLMARSPRPDAPLLTVAGSAVIAYGLQRGVHMQFLLWIYHALPYVLISGADLPPALALLVILLLDWCHAWVANVLRPLQLLQAAQLVLQGPSQWTAAARALAQAVTAQLRALSPDAVSAARATGQPVYRQLGAVYSEGFGWQSIPASLVLATVLLLCAWRLFERAYRARVGGGTKAKAQ